MLTFFPVIHSDELFYSIYVRYHERSLNKNVNQTLEELDQTKIEPPCTVDEDLRSTAYAISLMVGENIGVQLYSL